MRVSLRSTYGIMAAVDLALHAGTSPVQAKAIARRQGIPSRFLEQVLHAMKHAGVISSLRGAQGGYVLTRHPSELSLADIFEALETPRFTRLGANGHSSLAKKTKSQLLLDKVWERVHEAERQVLERITIEELAAELRMIEQKSTLMYHI
ncbi:MAG TPA: Rrf2 family transcriptional regulator [Nitrospira sp.]|nr:Rrf2 family transcriptional regulator [Nitrospira sp.]